MPKHFSFFSTDLCLLLHQWGNNLWFSQFCWLLSIITLMLGHSNILKALSITIFTLLFCRNSFGNNYSFASFAIFRSFHCFLILVWILLWMSWTFRRLSLSYSRAILAVCFGLLSYWMVKLHPSLMMYALWSRFLQGPILICLHSSSAFDQSPGLCCWEAPLLHETHQHDSL